MVVTSALAVALSTDDSDRAAGCRAHRPQDRDDQQLSELVGVVHLVERDQVDRLTLNGNDGDESLEAVGIGIDLRVEDLVDQIVQLRGGKLRSRRIEPKLPSCFRHDSGSVALPPGEAGRCCERMGRRQGPRTADETCSSTASVVRLAHQS